MPARKNHGFMRIFDQARTAHFERLNELTEAVFVYRRRSYDFDPGVASVPLMNLSRWRTLWLLVRHRPRVVEVNEPGAVNTWPSTFLYVGMIRVLNLLRVTTTTVVCYAIENGDTIEQVSGRLHLPRHLGAAVTRAAFRLLIPQGARIAFGTDQALDRYIATLPGVTARAQTRLFDPLTPACPSCELDAKSAGRVVFVGAFQERKGVLELLQSWPVVHDARPQASLHLLGTGPLRDDVIAFAMRRPEVHVSPDPSRGEIHDALAAAKCLVLPSKRDRYWREQIGLPILEGLSHACEIVTTDETGVTPWLQAHDHQVLAAAGEGSAKLARAIVRSLDSQRTAAELVAPLPAVDGRTRADKWLFRA